MKVGCELYFPGGRQITTSFDSEAEPDHGVATALCNVELDKWPDSELEFVIGLFPDDEELWGPGGPKAVATSICRYTIVD